MEGAATAKALDPQFVRKSGTVNIFVLEDLSNLEFWDQIIKKICRLVKKEYIAMNQSDNLVKKKIKLECHIYLYNFYCKNFSFNILVLNLTFFAD